MKSVQLIALLAISTLTVHCSDSGGDSKGGTTQRDIYTSDVSTISKMSASGPTQANNLTNGAFSKIFGGTSGKNVEAYIQARVKHVFNQQDMKNLKLSPDVGDPMGWKEEVPAADPNQPQTVAQNDGTALWVMSRVAGVPVSVIAGNQVIPVDSTRVGIISLGNSYQSAIDIEVEGKKHNIKFPPEYRISTVVHEARHSDCTGGFPEAYVQILQTVESMDDFLQVAGIEQLQCGHMHITCPNGHDYAGYPACDNELWGSYGVGAVYTLAAEKNYTEDTLDKRIMEMAHMDEMSRLLNSTGTASSTFSSSSPNMSHSNE